MINYMFLFLVLFLKMAATAGIGKPYEGFVDNNGTRIHFKAAGQGPLMVLLHGFPDNADTWDYQMAKFAKSYTVVCPTLRGYPPSDIPEDVAAYDAVIVMEDILRILDHFGAEKAIIGGHDFGGASIQQMAIRHPERVLGLMIINSPILPNFLELVNFDKDQQKLSEYTIAYHQYQPGDDKNVDYIVRTIRDPEHRQSIREYLTDSPIYGMLAHYKQNYPGPPYGQKIDVSMMKYQVPTLIIWGLEDEYFSLKHLDNLPQYFLAPLRLVTLPGVGHWPFRESPDEFYSEVSSWLMELNVTGRI